jgi:hypothetical protein
MAEDDNGTPAPTTVADSSGGAERTKKESSVTYEVGYGRPPLATRFQPKRSGNPKGRPRGTARGKPSIAKGALDRKVPVDVGGKIRRSSVRQLAFERIGERALSGDVRSVNFLLTRENKEEPAASNECPVPRETALDILRQYFMREQQKVEAENECEQQDDSEVRAGTDNG